MEEVTKVLPAIALRGTTILPDMIVHFDISRPKSVRAVEEAMLGDTGSNLLGGVAGVWLLTFLGPDARWIALAVVTFLTIYGEFRSISAAISSFPPLRLLDSLGRRDEVTEAD